MIIPLTSAVEGWEDNLKTCPQKTHTSIFFYFIDSVAADGEALRLISYFHSNKFGHAFLKEVGHDLFYLRADI